MSRKIEIDKSKCRIFTFAAVDLLFGCFFRLLVGWKLWFWHSSGSDSLCFGGTFDKFCRTICFLSDVRIIRHHRHQMMFPWVNNPFFCGMQAPKGDCCLACLRSTRYETSVGMTQPVSRLEMWKFPSQRIQEKQEDDLVQLMAGASSWHLEVDWKTLDGSFFPGKWVFFGLVEGWKI